MKHLLNTILLCIAVVIANAQQIVTHGFINYTACPTDFSQIYLCTNWYQPTGGTSDYLNACANGTNVGVPNNYWGTQACVDNAYVGLYTYAPAATTDYKEYIGTEIAPLTVGQEYEMSITVSLADNSSFATDGLGVYFSMNQYTYSVMYNTINVTPQIDYTSYGTITNKLSWVTLTKTFIADSPYRHIIIGCFKKNDDLRIDTVVSSLPDEQYSYYYISRIGTPDTTRQIIGPGSYYPTDPIDGVYNFPNAFTPNGDGLNDIFNMIASKSYDFKNYSLSIYNRWGERIYFTNSLKGGWDGTYNGTEQNYGVYHYWAEFTINNQPKTIKGNVTLMR